MLSTVRQDQGAQFTARDFVERLLDTGVQISMNGRGRALDYAFIGRLWRSVKYEDIYQGLTYSSLRMVLTRGSTSAILWDRQPAGREGVVSAKPDLGRWIRAPTLRGTAS